MIDVITELFNALMVNIREIMLIVTNFSTYDILIAILFLIVASMNIFFRGKNKRQNLMIEELEKSIKNEKKSARSLKNQVKEYKNQLEGSNKQIDQSEEIINDLTLQVEERENYLKELIKKTSHDKSRADDLDTLSIELKNEIENLANQLKEREETISNLNLQSKNQIKEIGVVLLHKVGLAIGTVHIDKALRPEIVPPG